MTFNQTNKLQVFFIGFGLFIVVLIFLFSKSLSPFFESSKDQNEKLAPSFLDMSLYETQKLSFEDSHIPELELWLADTPSKRSRGLSYLESLNENQGMLFIFDEPSNYPFWMKGMKISIDIVWLDNQGRIVFIKEGAHPEDYPESYIPESNEVMYVLEVVEGFVTTYGLALGDELDLDIQRENSL